MKDLSCGLPEEMEGSMERPVTERTLYTCDDGHSDGKLRANRQHRWRDEVGRTIGNVYPFASVRLSWRACR